MSKRTYKFSFEVEVESETQLGFEEAIKMMMEKRGFHGGTAVGNAGLPDARGCYADPKYNYVVTISESTKLKLEKP